MNIIFTTPSEMMQQIAERAKNKRLLLNFSQQSLAQRSGVSLGVLKKFEHTGKISLESLLKLALALGNLGDFAGVFILPAPETFPTIDAIMRPTKRKRGRK